MGSRIRKEALLIASFKGTLKYREYNNPSISDQEFTKC
jgi:hypothetical protein